MKRLIILVAIALTAMAVQAKLKAAQQEPATLKVKVMSDDPDLAQKVAEGLKARIGGMTRYEVTEQLTTGPMILVDVTCMNLRLKNGMTAGVVCSIAVDYSEFAINYRLHTDLDSDVTVDNIAEQVFPELLKATSRERIAEAQGYIKNTFNIIRAGCKN